MPQMLIDYLWKLVDSEEYAQDKAHVFTLTPHNLSGSDIQSVTHITKSHEEAQTHRLFGFPPVECNLLFYSDGSYRKLFVLENLNRQTII